MDIKGEMSKNGTHTTPAAPDRGGDSRRTDQPFERPSPTTGFIQGPMQEDHQDMVLSRMFHDRRSGK